MLIDWLTLRIPLTPALGENLYARLRDCMGVTVNIDCNGVEKWRKHSLDIDTLRSDCAGLFWSITCDANSQQYLSVGASPASIEHDGMNVFGSVDVEHCAKVLLNHVSVGLVAILPHWRAWQCRRLDITANYDMGSPAQVKQALRLLLATDAPRRRTNSDRKGGDSVYWNPSSDIKAAKAYHKGAHLRYLKKKGGFEISEDLLSLADNLLRLELKLGSRWFRRLSEAGHDWQDLTLQVLQYQHHSFFKTLIGDSAIEVNDMGKLLEELEKVCPSPARALAVHKTFALIKTLGYTQTKESTPKATFYKHCASLRLAGLSSADLCAGKVLELRMRTLLLTEPVLCWDDIRNRKAA